MVDLFPEESAQDLCPSRFEENEHHPRCSASIGIRRQVPTDNFVGIPTEMKDGVDWTWIVWEKERPEWIHRKF
jgi:hypothetical protein